MRVALAYAGVVLIWSTTPLAIQWSNSSLSFVTAISVRMVIALAVCLAILIAMRKPLVESSKDWLAFLTGAVGLFPNMLIVYWSAQFIPSGVMAVVLGMFPFTVGTFSYFILKENVFTVGKVLALIIAIMGLTLIHIEQMEIGGHAIYGVLGMLTSTILWGFSSVCMKAVGGQVDAFRLSTGVLLVATPGFIISWFFMDGRIPEFVDMHSMLGVIYLVIAGSVLGGTLFFYVLRHCPVDTVSLITLITPVIAIVIGMMVQDESLSAMSILGCTMIVSSLAIYQNVPGFFRRRIKLKI